MAYTIGVKIAPSLLAASPTTVAGMDQVASPASISKK